MHIITKITPFPGSTNGRVCLSVFIELTADDRDDLLPGLDEESVLNHLLLPCRFVGQALYVRDVIDVPKAVPAPNRRFAAALEQIIRQNGTVLQPVPPVVQKRSRVNPEVASSREPR